MCTLYILLPGQKMYIVFLSWSTQKPVLWYIVINKYIYIFFLLKIFVILPYILFVTFIHLFNHYANTIPEYCML